MSSSVASSCTCCPRASTGFATTVFWAIAIGRKSSSNVASSCKSSRSFRRRPTPQRRRTIETGTKRSPEYPCVSVRPVVAVACSLSSSSFLPGQRRCRLSWTPHEHPTASTHWAHSGSDRLKLRAARLRDCAHRTGFDASLCASHCHSSQQESNNERICSFQLCRLWAQTPEDRRLNPHSVWAQCAV